ncbi:MAG: ABC transporter substrate-binding protein [Dehalococcoidia bacterium]|nr:ABC transporter substrate-binding protein [Dehalococcoidia bacterium]
MSVFRRSSFATILGVVAIVVACAPASTPAPTGGAATGPTGPSGKLTVAVAAPLITSLDTGFGNDAQTLQFMWPAFDGLTWLSADGKINPGLAREWRSVDERTWEFRLGDYRFHNGRPVEAQDVVDTFARYRDPEKRLPNRTVFTGSGVEQVVAVDNKTVRIITQRAAPTVPNIIQLSMILPMRELNQMGEQAFFARPIGTGPFRVESVNFQGSIVYRAMGTDHPSPRGTPNFQELEIRIVPEVSSRIAALRTGEIDLAMALPIDQAGPLESAGFRIFTTNGTSTINYNLDTTTGPTADLRVRRAINYAVDKDTILRVFYGGRGRVDTGQLIGPSVLGFNQSLTPYPFDRDQARRLLAEAGYGNGFRIRLTTVQLATVNRDLAQIIADQLRDVGITVDIEVKETALWLQDFYGTPDRRPGMFVQPINWDQTFEPDAVYRWFSSDVGLDAGRRWQNEQFDRLYQAARVELNRERRGQLYSQAAAFLRDQAPVLFGWQINGVFAGKREITAGQPAHANFFVEVRRG